jgi:predicted alpha-1,2-mannosidase
MIASHSTPFLVSAYMKGIRDFDIETAYDGVRKNAFPGGLMSKSGYEHDTCFDGGIEYFIDRGYIPERERKSKGFHCDGAAMTLEYSYDHWCIAQLAKFLGKTEDAKYFMEKSKNYRNIWDSSIGFMRPRDIQGNFMNQYDPLNLEGFCEGNGWGYTYYVPHDIPMLIELMGGEKAFVDKLNSAFEKAGGMKYYAAKPELKRNEAYINYGNENTRFTASLFAHAGRADLSNYWSRKVQKELFSGIGLSCFCEDDDNGLSAGTSLLLAMGLFDIKGGAYENPEYEIGSPIFDEIHIHLDSKYYSGKTLSIIADINSDDDVIVEEMKFNGSKIDGFTISHDDIIKGGVIELSMGRVK